MGAEPPIRQGLVWAAGAWHVSSDGVVRTCARPRYVGLARKEIRVPFRPPGASRAKSRRVLVGRNRVSVEDEVERGPAILRF